MAAANAGRIDYTQPGPIDDSVLTQQATHRSEAIWNGRVKHSTKTVTCAHAFNPYNVHVFAYTILIHDFVMCRIQGPLPAVVVVQSSPSNLQWWTTE